MYCAACSSYLRRGPMRLLRTPTKITIPSRNLTLLQPLPEGNFSVSFERTYCGGHCYSRRRRSQNVNYSYVQVMRLSLL